MLCKHLTSKEMCPPTGRSFRFIQDDISKIYRYQIHVDYWLSGNGEL